MTTESPDKQIMSYGNYDHTNIGERTDTTELIERFRRMLSGTVKVTVEDANGDQVEKEVPKFPAIMNETGIRENLQFLESVAEKHSIMGNMGQEEYGNFTADNHIRFATLVADNAHRWGFTGDKRWLVGVMMNKIQTVSSRTIENKERELMNAPVRYVERSTDRETSYVPQQKRTPYF